MTRRCLDNIDSSVQACLLKKKTTGIYCIPDCRLFSSVRYKAGIGRKGGKLLPRKRWCRQTIKEEEEVAFRSGAFRGHHSLCNRFFSFSKDSYSAHLRKRKKNHLRGNAISHWMEEAPFFSFFLNVMGRRRRYTREIHHAAEGGEREKD